MTASPFPSLRKLPSSEKTPIRYFVSLPPRPASRRGGIFINISSTGRDSLSPHSKAASSLRIEGLLHRSRNCSRLGRDQPSGLPISGLFNLLGIESLGEDFVFFSRAAIR